MANRFVLWYEFRSLSSHTHTQARKDNTCVQPHGSKSQSTLHGSRPPAEKEHCDNADHVKTSKCNDEGWDCEWMVKKMKNLSKNYSHSVTWHKGYPGCSCWSCVIWYRHSRAVICFWTIVEFLSSLEPWPLLHIWQLRCASGTAIMGIVFIWKCSRLH